MPIQSIMWTALPNGLTPDGRAVRLSVLASPRLDPQAAARRLDSFPAFEHWPATLAEARFTVRLGTRTVELRLSDADATLGVPDDATWAALLPPDTFVRGFVFKDRAAHKVLSYDTVGMHQLVRDVYAGIAVAAGDDLPAVGDLRVDKPIRDVMGAVQSIDRSFWDHRRRQRDVRGQLSRWRQGFPGLDETTRLLATFQLFHTPPSKQTTQTFVPQHDPRTAVTWRTHERVTLTKDTAAQAVRDFDFHQIVAAMNQYPVLLRRLGLVVDFVIPGSALTAGANLALDVTVKLPPAAGVGAPVRSASPVTRTRFTNTAFAPVSRPAPSPTELRVADGRLRFDAGRVALLQADVDGAGHKLMNFARTLANHGDASRQLDPVTKLPRRAGAPALRTAGLMLVHSGRGAAVEAAFTRNQARNTAVQQKLAGGAGAAPELHAEDLVRGWRVDVWDRSTGRWRSLCERVAEYRVDGGAITLAGVREEGAVRLAATAAADGSDPDVLRLHEALAVWSGWSLVAPPPGRTVDLDDSLRDAPADAPPGVRMRTAFVPAPGSLPRLRYGHDYAVRARAVDLAGNSLPPTVESYPGDETAIAAATPYLRFEPVQPPVLAIVGTGAAREAPLEGESMSRIAVRTLNDTFDDPTATAQVARRWMVAPRTSQTEAERHGALDGAAWGSAAQYDLLTTRDAALPHEEFAMPGPLAGALTDVAGAAQLARRVQAADPVPPARYAALPETATLLPYLPDPLCTRIAARLRNHPGIAPGTTIPIPLYPDGRAWPDAAPIFIRVYEAAGEVPRFDEPSRTLLVPTPKAVRATLRLSAMLTPESLDLMGVWRWVPDADRTPVRKAAALAGRLWPLTPWRTVEIVHAVQRPLLQPTITDMRLDRELGRTWVTPGVDARVHRASTDRVELHAAWHEPRDGGTAPTDRARSDVAYAVKITDPLGYDGVTEHRVPVPADPNRIVFGPIKPIGDPAQREQRARVHDFGDTRYRRVEYHLTGTSRFREYMQPELLVEPTGDPGEVETTEAHVSLEGPAVRTWVPSSAPPPAPEVLYVVPTFAWTRAADAAGKRTSWRRGGGLRVWLDRPWNASGYGEMLGVVLPPAGTAIEPNDPPYKQAVTQWGNDPAWKSPFVSGVAPKAADFPLARTAPDPTGAWLPPGAPATEADQPGPAFSVTNLRHPALAPDASTGMVDVAPHDVRWDEERRLWYCDIEVDHGPAYFPFLRLALARYQPSSLWNAHLSNVVLADFMSLAPDRWLSVARTDASKRQVRVFGFSHTQSAGHAEAWTHRTEAINPVTGRKMTFVPTGISPTNVVEVWLERLNPVLGEDFGWQRVADGEPTPEVSPARPVVGPAVRPVVVRPAGRAAKRGTAKTASARQLAADAARTARSRELLRRREFDLVVKDSLLDAVLEWPTLWSGSLTLPSAPAGTRFRAVVAEYEEYLVDDADPYGGKLERKDRRLVFVEHVELG